MATANLNNLFVDHQKILGSFANAQLDEFDTQSAKHNQFFLFAITSFLHGATNQLGKQSNLPTPLQQKYLQNLLCEIFSLPRHSAEGLLSSVERMMGNYYLLENIYQEGESAAEKWLNSEVSECHELRELMNHYSDFTLMDMKAAGMKPAIPGLVISPVSHEPRGKKTWKKVIAWIVVLSMLSGSALLLLQNHYFNM